MRMRIGGGGFIEMPLKKVGSESEPKKAAIEIECACTNRWHYGGLFG